ncbi:MAG: ribosome silencing factor [Clostridia bacterium]|nr:ribosome silencing factor [Clostridia bacterium]
MADKFSLNEPLDLAKFCVQALDKKNASDIRVFRVEEQTIIADYYVICCGRSTTHVNALSDEVEYQLGENGIELLRVDGRGTGTWVLMDYASVLVHVFTKEQRDFYKIEKLYNEDNEIDIKDLLTGLDSAEDSED